MKATTWSTAWVTGASSGIGRALVLELARRGVRVAASARRLPELEALAALDARITPFPIDVTDLSSVTATAAEIVTRLGPIDLAVFNAGIGMKMGGRDFDAALAARTMAVNYMGLVNGIAAVQEQMIQRGRGQIALMSSIAGYRGLPGEAAYCPTKAAAISLAEALEPELDAAGVSISVINPGYVDTPMIASAGRRLPFVITPEDAALRIIAGLDRDKFEIAFPWQMVALGKLARILPYRAYLWVMARNLPRDPRNPGE